MDRPTAPSPPPLMVLDGVVRRFGALAAVDGVSGVIPAGHITGLVGPDGAGKTTLMRLMAGLLLPDVGTLSNNTSGTEAIGYMPQRFGLYEDLSVAENLSLYADLHGLTAQTRTARVGDVLHFTGLGPFTARLAGRLSGGMKQKLGLGCALLSHPSLLLLDEPSVGVDPISRRELWSMVRDLAARGIGVVWSTAYMDEAERCDSVFLMNEGRVLFDGPPATLTQRMAGHSFALSGIDGDARAVRRAASEQPGVIDALILGGEVRIVMDGGHQPPLASDLDTAPSARLVSVPPRFEDAFCTLLHDPAERHRVELTSITPSGEALGNESGAMVEARNLVRRFGAFTAVDDISFSVARGEIFGLLGPNGAGKSTTFRMLCGLLPVTSGTAAVAGLNLSDAGPAARQRIGYMAQKFALYGQLSVRQNLDFFAGAYGLSARAARQASERMIDLFGLAPFLDSDADTLAFGYKQRLALASALMHKPAVLFLDEPTSGVDPLTRREFWSHINALAGAGVTTMVTTHYLDEAEYCDRLGLIYRGRLIAEGSPRALKDGAKAAAHETPSLEDAFIRLVEADDKTHGVPS